MKRYLIDRHNISLIPRSTCTTGVKPHLRGADCLSEDVRNQAPGAGDDRAAKAAFACRILSKNRLVLAPLVIAANHVSCWIDADGSTTRLRLWALPISISSSLTPPTLSTSPMSASLPTTSTGPGELGVNVNYSWLDEKYALYGKMSTPSKSQQLLRQLHNHWKCRLPLQVVNQYNVHIAKHRHPPVSVNVIPLPFHVVSVSQDAF